MLLIAIFSNNRKQNLHECECKIKPKDYFADMSPIFCTSEIEYDDFGEHMQKFVSERELSRKPRRLLVGGMKARKILLATPLLKWYLEKGQLR